MLRTRIFAFLTVVALMALLAPQAMAKEVIERFDTVITVSKDRSVKITETIVVIAEGKDIQRGIFRDIPIVLRGRFNAPIRQEFELESVKRDGETEPYNLSEVSYAMRIRIGDADYMLEPGKHVYEITYTMSDGARVFDDYDELYWNVTGNFWQFPIYEAKTRVVLPEGANITELNVYTGKQGDTANAATKTRVSDNVAEFETTQVLGVEEGMTVSVAFDKGILTPPPPEPTLWEWLLQPKQFYSIETVFLTSAILLALWYYVGRDPKRGVIIPRFNPPKDISPAVAYFMDQKYVMKNEHKAFSTAILSLASKGLLKISKKSSSTILTVTEKNAENKLAEEEQIVFDFVRTKSPLTINKKSGKGINATIEAFTKSIQSGYKGIFYQFNFKYIPLILLITFGAWYLLILQETMSGEHFWVNLFLYIFLLVLAVFITKGNRFIRVVGILASLGLLYFMYWAYLSPSLLMSRETGFVAAFIISIVSISVFLTISKATPKGRQAMDELEGLKLYLETAEKDRMNFQDEPDMTTQRYEVLLPYAMALGVEKPWSERFETDLKRGAVTGASVDYSPIWLSGSNFKSSSFSDSISTASHSLGAALVASTPQLAYSSGSSSGSSGGSSSSSSGSSGGGSSGGGGGGGGGGGW